MLIYHLTEQLGIVIKWNSGVIVLQLAFPFLVFLNAPFNGTMTRKKKLWIFHQVRISERNLKGLSHEIDFDNIKKNWRMLALISAAAGFFFIKIFGWNKTSSFR